MDIATQVTKYFATAADATATGEAVPHTSSGNTVTPYIDGRRYFRAIRALLTTMGTGPTVPNQFFYVAGWWLHFTEGSLIPIKTTTDPPQSPTTRETSEGQRFRLNDDIHPDPGPLMAELLAKRAADGVDVRVMAWANPAILREAVQRLVGWPWNVVTHNLLSIEHLRLLTVGGVQPLAQRVIALTMGHLFGAMHLKMVIAHDGTKPWAFVGGIDFESARADREMHPGATPDSVGWHDMMVAVDGPAIDAIYALFQNLWNLQKAHPVDFLIDDLVLKGVESGTTDVPGRLLPSAGSGKHHVQIAMTLPQYNFDDFAWVPFGTTPLAIAPDGSFQVKVALKKAIDNATEYIYIEDQSFWSQDVMQWIHDRLQKNADVKVILLTGALDPKDPTISWPMVEAVNCHLLDGLSSLEEARVGLFRLKSIFVHAKVTIIDDHWLFVGSANRTRRGLYTDIEMSVATLDEEDELAKKVRVDLWGEHFGLTTAERGPLEPLSDALAVWNDAWGASPPFDLPTTLIEVLSLTPKKFLRQEYRFLDADSREKF